jgi:hypothetical protein
MTGDVRNGPMTAENAKSSIIDSVKLLQTHGIDRPAANYRYDNVPWENPTNRYMVRAIVDVEGIALDPVCDKAIQLD